MSLESKHREDQQQSADHRRKAELAKINAAVRSAINNYLESGEHSHKVEALRIAALHGYTYEMVMALADLISADGVAGVGMPRAVAKTHNISRVVEGCEQLNKELSDRQSDKDKETDAETEKKKKQDISPSS